MDDRGWRMDNRGWRMEDGGWRMMMVERVIRTIVSENTVNQELEVHVARCIVSGLFVAPNLTCSDLWCR